MTSDDFNMGFAAGDAVSSSVAFPVVVLEGIVVVDFGTGGCVAWNTSQSIPVYPVTRLETTLKSTPPLYDAQQ